MTLSAPLATLLAATIAAVASILVLFLRLRSGESAEARAAYRDELRPYVQEIGDALYMLVACATLYARDHATNNRDHWNRQLDTAAGKLRAARFRVRYQLWGLDEGLRTMVFLSFWIRQAEADERAQLIEAATRLRQRLDRVIMRCFLRGRPPTLSERTGVSLATRHLRGLGLKLSAPEDIDLVRNPPAGKRTGGGASEPYPKTTARIISREGDVLTALGEDGREYTLNARHRSGKRSRSEAQPGTEIKLYQRPGEPFFRYRFRGS